MSRFYSFSLKNKEVDYASDLKDFLPNKKALLNHYNDLPTELYRLFFVQDICHMSIFRTKRELLIALKERFENAEISKKILRKGGKNENQRNNRKMAIY